MSASSSEIEVLVRKAFGAHRAVRDEPYGIFSRQMIRAFPHVQIHEQYGGPGQFQPNANVEIRRSPHESTHVHALRRQLRSGLASQAFW